MADEIRRVRTQAERDADGTPWLHGLIGVQTADGRIHAPQDVALIYPPDPDIRVTTEPIAPPRRCWWHRYTRTRKD